VPTVENNEETGSFAVARRLRGAWCCPPGRVGTGLGAPEGDRRVWSPRAGRCPACVTGSLCVSL